MTRSVVDDEDFRNAVCDWLRANGIDPARVPADSPALIASGQLTLLEKVRGENGRDVVIHQENRVMTRTITVPVVVAPTPLIEQWLTQP